MSDNKSMKLTALLLCAALLLTPLTGIAAAWDEASGSVRFMEIPYITRDEYFDRPVEETGAVSLQAVDDGRVMAAAAQLRKGMVARKNAINVKIYAPGVTWDNEWINALWNKVWDLSFANTGVPNEGDYLSNNWENCHGQSLQNGSVITLTYFIDYRTTAQQEKEFDAELARVLSSLDLEGKSDFRKVETVYNWICGNIEYDYEHLNTPDPDYEPLEYTAYAALKYHTCVCQGYALLLYRMLSELGVGCHFIYGYGGGGRHAWNTIRLGKLWYNADSTWDAGVSEYRYFLVSDEHFSDHEPNERFTTDDWNEKHLKSPVDYAVPQAEVPVEDVELDRSSISIGVGESYKLTPTAAPESSDGRYFVWNIYSGDDVIYVDDGVVTGLKPGTASVYVRPMGSPETAARCDVTVTGGGTYVMPEKIKALPRKLVLEEGTVSPVNVTFRPENTTNKGLRWSVDDPSVATVDNDGNVTAVSEGVTSLSLCSEADPWLNNPWLADRITVKVVKPGYVETTGISTNTDDAISINKGQSVNASFRIVFSPANATDREVDWQSGNENIAVVDEYGMVTGISHGYATVTARLKEDPDKFVRIGVQVNGDDSDQDDDPGYDPGLDPDIDYDDDTSYGSALIADAKCVGDSVSARVMGVETGTYKFYLASYGADGRLLGVTSRELDLERGKFADIEASAAPGVSRGVIFGWDVEGNMPIADTFTFLQPYPQKLTSSNWQSENSFHEMHGSTGKTAYTFTLRDNGSADSGIMLGNSEVLNGSSDNYFRDGSVVILFANGVLYTRDGSNKTMVASYAVGTDVKIRIEADIPANTYDLWVNDMPAARGVKFRTATDIIDRMALVENTDYGMPFNIMNFEQTNM